MSRLSKVTDYREILVTSPARQSMPLRFGARWAGPAPLSRNHIADLLAEAQEDRGRYLRAAIVMATRLAITPFVAAAKSWRTWRVRQRDREELAQLDDRAFRDMGITRYDALMAAKGEYRRD